MLLGVASTFSSVLFERYYRGGIWNGSSGSPLGCRHLCFGEHQRQAGVKVQGDGGSLQKLDILLMGPVERRINLVSPTIP